MSDSLWVQLPYVIKLRFTRGPVVQLWQMAVAMASSRWVTRV
jgi:hypothetical protein